MFGISFSEIIVILVLFVLITNPKDFPNIIKELGTIYKKINIYISMFKKNINTLFDEQENKKNTTKKTEKTKIQ